MKTFVAYLIPKHDYHLVLEDGLGFVEVGLSREEAITKLKMRFAESFIDTEDENWEDFFESENTVFVAECD